MIPKSKTRRRHLIKTAELGDIENRIRSRAY